MENVRLVMFLFSIEDLQAAMQVAAKAIRYYEKLLKIPYPLPKLDLVAVPNFPTGAMGNWGLIVISMDKLATNRQHSSSKEWTETADVIASECAHMWFGSFVTMEYWGSAWLDEGFAAYLKFFGAGAGLPGYHPMKNFFASTDVPGFELDQMSLSHPLALSDDEMFIDGHTVLRFDAITSQKV